MRFMYLTMGLLERHSAADGVTDGGCDPGELR